MLGLTERTIKADGTIAVSGGDHQWLGAALVESIEPVIALYHLHGTHEQFHGELKTRLDLERLPSGKFDINMLVLSLEAVACDILRLAGQQSLLKKSAPLRHRAKRR